MYKKKKIHVREISEKKEKENICEDIMVEIIPNLLKTLHIQKAPQIPQRNPQRDM